MTTFAEWSEFVPTAYLREYYSDLGSENLAIVRFLTESFRGVPPGALVLDFGCGPTCYSALVAAPYAREIHVCDCLSANLHEIEKWRHGHADSFQWDAFAKQMLILEGHVPSARLVNDRLMLTRSRLTQVLHCDGNCKDSFENLACQYDVVVTNFCAESSTSNREKWRGLMGNIAAMVRSHGRIIISALAGADSYSVGREVFPAVPIHEDDLRGLLLEFGFDAGSFCFASVPQDRPARHYEGIVFASATKSSGTTPGSILEAQNVHRPN